MFANRESWEDDSYFERRQRAPKQEHSGGKVLWKGGLLLSWIEVYYSSMPKSQRENLWIICSNRLMRHDPSPVISCPTTPFPHYYAFHYLESKDNYFRAAFIDVMEKDTIELVYGCWTMAVVYGIQVSRNVDPRVTESSGMGIMTPLPPDTICLLYTSPSPRDQRGSRMPSSS